MGLNAKSTQQYLLWIRYIILVMYQTAQYTPSDLLLSPCPSVIKPKPTIEPGHINPVCAPVPACHYRNPKHHPRPGQIPCGRVPRQAEGVLSGSVAVGGDVVPQRVQGGDGTGYRRPVARQQSTVASYFSKIWKRGEERMGTILNKWQLQWWEGCGDGEVSWHCMRN